MSTGFDYYDLSEHCWISVDADGNGPAYGDDFDRWVCWCGQGGCDKPPGRVPSEIPERFAR